MVGDRVTLVDTTLRDGQQSLWALRMPVEGMLGNIEDIDGAGFGAIEFVVPAAQFIRQARELGEDPWEWIRRGAGSARNTPLRLHGTGASSFRPIPRCIQVMLLEKLLEVGIAETRISDPWNDFSAIRAEYDLLRGLGFAVIVNVIYSVSPRHTVAYYESKVGEAIALAPNAICLKDVGGLLTPEVARVLLPVVIRAAGEVPIEFHAHCNSGLATYVLQIAAEAGIRTFHTAIPPLANGSSQPSVFTVAANLEAKGLRVDVDLGRLRRVEGRLRRVASYEGLPEGNVEAYDEALFRHQVPGGMISNLKFQLDQVSMRDRLSEALEEIGRVRQDLGYPIMVTPLSQFVGTQALMNVVTGCRYSLVTDEIIRYALGQWGADATRVMDPSIRGAVLERPRARELREDSRAKERDLGIAEVRKRLGACSDDELIVRAFLGDRGLQMPRQRPERAWGSAGGIMGTRLGEALRALAAAKEVRHVLYSENGLRLYARKGDAPDW